MLKSLTQCGAQDLICLLIRLSFQPKATEDNIDNLRKLCAQEIFMHSAVEERINYM